MARWLNYALRYAALGWKVFPLHGIRGAGCTCGDADCRSAGKHPLTPHGVKDASSDEAQLRAWAGQFPDSNLGLSLTGGLVAVDTDPRNGGDATLDALLEEHGAFPETALAMTGGGGTHHLFFNRSGRKLPGKLGKGVDLKGEGGYIVVEPSIHASGTAYAWEASSDPLDGALVADLPDWIGREQMQAPAAQPQAGRGFIPVQQVVELRSALTYLDADCRDTWVQVGMALHSTDADNAFGLWTEWSQLSAKFDPIDQGRVWASFTGKPNGLNVTSIFAWATKRGWVNPASAQAHRFSDEVEAAIARANSERSITLVETPEPTLSTTLPVPALNDLAEWITRRYALTHPAVTTQTVLALAALGASRVYVGEDHAPCHVCLGVVSESAILSSYARDAVAHVMDASGLRRMMRGTRANAPTQVYATLWRSPAAIHVVGDYGHLAQFAKRQPSGVLDQAFAVMAEAYNSSALYLDSATEAGMKPSASDDQLVVRNPALTTLLLSTQEQMGALLQRGELTRGLLAYQLPVIAQTEHAIECVPSGDPLPKSLIDLLLAVRRISSSVPGDKSMQEIFGSMPGSKPNLVRVRHATPYTEYANAISSVSTELAHRPLVLAAVGTARRLVNALAPWRDPATPVATREIMDWVTGYVVHNLKAWLEQYSTLGNDDGTVDVGQKVVAYVASRRKEGVQRSQLQNFCHAFRRIRDRDKRNALIDSLLADGEIVEIVPEGRRAKVLVLARYVKAELRAVA